MSDSANFRVETLEPLILLSASSLCGGYQPQTCGDAPAVECDSPQPISKTGADCDFDFAKSTLVPAATCKDGPAIPVSKFLDPFAGKSFEFSDESKNLAYSNESSKSMLQASKFESTLKADTHSDIVLGKTNFDASQAIIAHPYDDIDHSQINSNVGMTSNLPNDPADSIHSDDYASSNSMDTVNIDLPVVKEPDASDTSVPVAELESDTKRDTPLVSAIVNTGLDIDLNDPLQQAELLTAWKTSVDELSQLGAEEVTFTVYREVHDGRLINGPAVSTIEDVVAYANESGLKSTVVPVFTVADVEDAWRGLYNPSGSEQQSFQSDYAALLNQLADVPGIDRLNVGSELNAMVQDTDNAAFLKNLTNELQSKTDDLRIGYVANFDSFDNEQHQEFWDQANVDYLGVSGYFSLIDPQDAKLVEDVGSVSQEVQDLMKSRWNTQLDKLEAVADRNDLKIVVQEFGTVAENYASIYPFAAQPGDFVAEDASERYTADSSEQIAAYQSLLDAIQGRGDKIESVFFWSWENEFDQLYDPNNELPANQSGRLNDFAISADSGGGKVLADYLRS